MFKVIKSVTNPYIKQIVKLRKEKKYREKEKKVLIVGKNTIEDIAKTQLIDTLIVTDENLLQDYPDVKNVILVNFQIMKKITGVETPQELAAIVYYKPKEIKNKNYVLILDNISDPGNLGTIIRTANAFNFDLIIFSKDCTDPFSDKALRASKGSIFFIPTLMLSEKEIGFFIEENKLNLYLADINGKSIADVKFKKPFALILSSEAKGPSEFFKEIAQKVTIPIKKDIDSLNVAIAAGIFLYLSRQ
jgi:RNA methyltransferase, TrmH family